MPSCSSHDIILADNIMFSGPHNAPPRSTESMELKQWLSTLSAELEIGDVAMDDDAVRTLLDLARDSPHEVERIAAPLTTFLVGIALGRGASLTTAAATATTLLLNQEAAD
jgi:Domain of unknown function (DUF6457)